MKCQKIWKWDSRFDTRTLEGLLEVLNFVEVIQKRQGFYTVCLKKIIYQKNWITKEQLSQKNNQLKKFD